MQHIKKKLKIGVIGLGVGEAHIKSYQKIKNVEVNAVCDIDRKKLNYIRRKYDIEQAYTDSKKITENPDIDIISICSFDNDHFDQLISSFKNGKHIMVEKPVVLYKKEAEKVIRAWKDSKCKITSNLILRSSPRFINLKKLIKKGSLGKIYHIEGDYLHFIIHKIIEGWRGRMPFYCTVYGGGIHLIDLIRWLLEEEIDKVSSMGNNILTKGTSFKYPETICSLMQFKNGITAKTMTTFGPKRTKFHSLNVYGSKRTFINSTEGAQIFSGDKKSNRRIDNTPYQSFEKGDLLPEFISSIRSNKEHEVTGEDVFRVMDICFAIWDSYKKNKFIKVSYLV